MIKSIAILALLSITGCAGTYFNDASVYAGIDYTAMDSPMCLWDNGEGGDVNLTANMGAKLNVWRSDDKSTGVYAKWTHHSCVFADDAPQYDGFGMGMEYTWDI